MEASAEDAAMTVPPQYKPQPEFDLRASGIGPRGFKMRQKRKLDVYEEQVGRRGALADAALSSRRHAAVLPAQLSASPREARHS